MTVSGVHRGLQRALYDKRREELIPAHGLGLVIVRPADLDSDGRGRLRRSADADLESLVRLLAPSVRFGSGADEASRETEKGEG
jgi:hypothetical protein